MKGPLAALGAIVFSLSPAFASDDEAAATVRAAAEAVQEQVPAVALNSLIAPVPVATP